MLQLFKPRHHLKSSLIMCDIISFKIERPWSRVYAEMREPGSQRNPEKSEVCDRWSRRWLGTIAKKWICREVWEKPKEFGRGWDHVQNYRLLTWDTEGQKIYAFSHGKQTWKWLAGSQSSSVLLPSIQSILVSFLSPHKCREAIFFGDVVSLEHDLEAVNLRTASVLD